MSILLLILALLFQSPVPALQGVVMKAGSNEPVVKATIELHNTDDTAGVPISTTTGKDGGFSFRTIPAGKYDLTVTRAGYVQATYGEQKPGGPGTPITLPLTGSPLRLLLTPTAVISGRIIDGRGQPLANATVSAMTTSYSQGRQTLSERQATITDDLGEYRLFFLTPGKYYVGATPTSSARGIGLGAQGDRINDFRIQRENTRTKPVETDEVDAVTYFPGTRDPVLAGAITLKPGEEVSGIDIIAGPVHSHHIRGSITGLPGMNIVGDGTLRLGGTSGSRLTGGKFPDFDMPGILAGIYILSATLGNISGRVPVEVLDADLNGVVIPLANTFSVTGRIVVEGGGPQNPGPDPKTLRVNLRSVPEDGNFPTSPNPAADGTFTVADISPGTYIVSLNPAMTTGYLKSVRFGNTEALTSGITFRGPPDSPILVTISANPGRIDGRVLNDLDQALPNARVVLVPELSQRSRTELFRNVVASPTGEFKLQGLVPGNYKLFAWQEIENGAWLNADFMRLNEEKGIEVSVVEGSTGKIDLHAIVP